MTALTAFHSACKCKTDMLTKIHLEKKKKIKQHINWKFYQENILIENYKNIVLHFQNRVHLGSTISVKENHYQQAISQKYSGHSKA